ncbi:SDR family oxidoreductase [Nocardioides sp. Bht2]|uniref:SDR family oxidoreductase n=1 Tax=Nocardioides sp. Bht2 TaxID=3392297 RepID=UPI0039B520C5
MSLPAHPQRRPVLVAGASSGIGAATARAMAALGHPVALGARRVDACAALAQEIGDAGGEAFAHPLDLATQSSVDEFVAASTEALGAIEALVCSAAVLRPGRIVETPPERFGEEVEINVLGVHRLVAAVVPGMVERQRGDVVLISSDCADAVRPFMSSYATTKWAIEGFARSLRLETEGSGVRVGVVRPGPTWTGMGMDWNAEETSMVLDGWSRLGFTRSGHFMTPDVVADVIATMVRMPRGASIPLVDVQPEIELEKR